MKQSVRRLTIAAAALAMFVPAAASAQQQPKAQQRPQAQEQPAQTPDAIQENIPDQKLDAAAAAMQQVASLKQTFQQRYDSAAPAEKEQIANEASAALTKVVTDKGLSIEEYSAILATAQENPTVRDKILDRIRKPQQ